MRKKVDQVVELRTVDGKEFLPFNSLEEYGSDGQALEVYMSWIPAAQIVEGNSTLHRFKNFFPFKQLFGNVSLGEGNTPLLPAGEKLAKEIGISNLLLKNETVNPTWSFKDRGSWAMMQHALNEGEKVTATVSTGNMGNSTAAYAQRAGIQSMIIVPSYTAEAKIAAAKVHGAKIVKVDTKNFSDMKKHLSENVPAKGIRLSSGNNPIRVEGYKLMAFELYEQLGGRIPDYIAIPTSACGHIRGVYKGFVELNKAGLVYKIPKMIVIQAENNAPIVNALEKGMDELDVVDQPNTIATAISSGNPQGGEEIIQKAKENNWLYTKVSEANIKEGQQKLAQAGFFVEPSSATIYQGLKQVADQIKEDAIVISVLTGSGLKDVGSVEGIEGDVVETDDDGVLGVLR